MSNAAIAYILFKTKDLVENPTSLIKFSKRKFLDALEFFKKISHLEAQIYCTEMIVEIANLLGDKCEEE